LISLKGWEHGRCGTRDNEANRKRQGCAERKNQETGAKDEGGARRDRSAGRDGVEGLILFPEQKIPKGQVKRKDAKSV